MTPNHIKVLEHAIAKRWDELRREHGWMETIPDLAGVVDAIRQRFEPAPARAAARGLRP